MGAWHSGVASTSRAASSALSKLGMNCVKSRPNRLSGNATLDVRSAISAATSAMLKGTSIPVPLILSPKIAE